MVVVVNKPTARILSLLLLVVRAAQSQAGLVNRVVEKNRLHPLHRLVTQAVERLFADRPMVAVALAPIPMPVPGGRGALAAAQRRPRPEPMPAAQSRPIIVRELPGPSIMTPIITAGERAGVAEGSRSH